MRLNLLSALLVLISSPAFAANGDMPASKDEPVVDFRIETVGTATYNFQDRRFADVFKKTLIFGHSISSGLMASVRVFQPYGEGPGTILSKNYAKRDPLANMSEGIGNMETGLTKMYRWVEQQDDTDASEGDNRRISVMNKYFDEATAIVGVDALYMTVVFNECEDYGSNLMYFTIDRFVDKSYRAGKVLILGSVPKEDWSKATLLTQAVLKNENESCRQTVNKILANACRPDRNCYINDVEGIVHTLNTKHQLILKDGTVLLENTGFPFYNNEVRPDGINLSERGVQALVEDILERMGTNPPKPVLAPPMMQAN